MQNVIGGEFKIQMPDGLPLSVNPVNLFCSGRGALSAILNHLFTEKDDDRKVLLPDYLCSSITKVCIDKNIPYSFYHVQDNLLPDESDLLGKINDEDIVLLMSYFGMIKTESVAKVIKEKSPETTIIIDDVQNFYSTEKYSVADYRFNSYRKWFAVPDGAEVFCKSECLKVPEKDNDFAKYKFSGNVLKNFADWIDDDLCLDLIEKGEAILDEQYDCKCSRIGQALIQRISFDEIKNKRMENAAYLHEQLEKMGVNHVYERGKVPLFVPIFVENRNAVRKELFSNAIFAPIHWPFESPNLNGFEKNPIYDKELSLICDQRYSLDDMDKQLGILRKCI